MPFLTGKQYQEVEVFRKNIIQNGDFAVNQRNFSTQAVVQFGGYYVADRTFWYTDVGATTSATLSRSTDVPTYAEAGVVFPASIDFSPDTAVASLPAASESAIIQRVEGYNYDRIRGGSGTFSFWVKTNKTGVYTAAFRNAASDAFYISEFTVNQADTWEKKNVTLPLDYVAGTWNYTNGYGIQVAIGVAAGSSAQTSTLNQWKASGGSYSINQVNLFDSTANYFRTTGWQFEKGITPTEFEAIPFGESLQACQRYYEHSYNYGVLPGTVTGQGADRFRIGGLPAGTSKPFGTSVKFSVKKRAAPSVTMYSNNTGASNAVYDNVAAGDITPSLFNVGDSSFAYTGTGTSSNQLSITAHWRAISEFF